MNKVRIFILSFTFLLGFIYQPNWVYNNFWFRADFYDSIPFTPSIYLYRFLYAVILTGIVELTIRFIKKYA